MSRSIAMEILSAIVASGRAGARRDHEGPVEDRTFEVGAFERLEIAGPFDVEIDTGADSAVRATGPDWALDNLSVDHDGDRLFIGCDGEVDDVRVFVSARELRAVRTSGSGDVSIDRIKGETFEYASSGSGDGSIGEIEAERLNVSASGSGGIRIQKARGDHLEASVIGSGDLSLDAAESAEFKLTMNGSGTWLASNPSPGWRSAASWRCTTRIPNWMPRATPIRKVT